MLVDSHRGATTGCNQFFILSASSVARLGLPPGSVTPILPRMKTLHTDVIPADFTSGIFLLTVGDRAVAAVSDYLDHGERTGVAALTACAARTPWYAINVCPAPPIVVNRIGRHAFRFVVNLSHMNINERFIGLTPRPLFPHVFGSALDFCRLATAACASLSVDHTYTNLILSTLRSVRIPCRVPLGLFFDIHAGIFPPKKDFFILTPERVRELALTPDVLLPWRWTPKSDSVRFLFSSKVDKGALPAPARAYVESGEARGVHRGIASQPWYHVRHGVPPPLICKRLTTFAASVDAPFRFEANPAMNHMAQSFLCLRPTPAFAEVFGADADVAAFAARMNTLPLAAFESAYIPYGTSGLVILSPRGLADVSVSPLLSP
jgi:hypothetical protein